VLCDVQLVANDNVEVATHRAVLAACSHYFYSMFTGELTESRQDRVTLCQIDGAALCLLVDFMYTSEIRVAEDNVQVLCGVDFTKCATWYCLNICQMLTYLQNSFTVTLFVKFAME